MGKTEMTYLLANWKTTAGGAILILLFVAKSLGITVANVDLSHLDMTAIVALIGGWIGLAAKDGNVTGGTKPQ
jgi:hypothetical protein